LLRSEELWGVKAPSRAKLLGEKSFWERGAPKREAPRLFLVSGEPNMEGKMLNAKTRRHFILRPYRCGNQKAEQF